MISMIKDSAMRVLNNDADELLISFLKCFIVSFGLFLLLCPLISLGDESQAMTLFSICMTVTYSTWFTVRFINEFIAIKQEWYLKRYYDEIISETDRAKPISDLTFINKYMRSDDTSISSELRSIKANASELRIYYYDLSIEEKHKASFLIYKDLNDLLVSYSRLSNESKSLRESEMIISLRRINQQLCSLLVVVDKRNQLSFERRTKIIEERSKL